MEWRDLPQQVLFALQSLESAGYEAALVGGCVRDRLMGRTPGDYDIATSALPEETLKVFERERTVPTGIQHGTVTLIYRGMSLEITTFREDGSYTDMRRPDSVRFTSGLREDVLRRDFTMNAMAWELKRGIIDYTGGAADIAAGVIRAVGDPQQRFAEDALRMLRAIRFHSQLGFSIEPETDRALRLLHTNIDRIAAERIRVELEKTLRGPHAAEALADYRDVLRARLSRGAFIDDAQWEESAARLSAVKQALAELPAGNAVLWAALLMPAGPQRAAECLQALRADNASIRGVHRLLTLAAQELNELYPLRCAVGEYDMQTAQEAVCLRYAFEADARSHAFSLLNRIAEQALPCKMAELAVNGTDLQALGITGRQIGNVLQALLDDVRAGRVLNERAALLASAAAHS